MRGSLLVARCVLSAQPIKLGDDPADQALAIAEAAALTGSSLRRSSGPSTARRLFAANDALKRILLGASAATRIHPCHS